MGIYIPNVEFPKQEELLIIDSNGNVEVVDKNGNTSMSEHKAFGLPPHGDLIDRDELDDWFYATPIFTSDENADVWKVIRLDDIDNAPTIINAERRFYAL